MQPESIPTGETGHAAITDVVGLKQQTIWQSIRASQSFWVAIALLVLMAVMTIVRSEERV